MFMDDRTQREKEAQKQIGTMQHHMEQLMRLVERSPPTTTYLKAIRSRSSSKAWGSTVIHSGSPMTPQLEDLTKAN